MMRRHTGAMIGILLAAMAAWTRPAAGYDAQAPAMVLDLEGSAWDVTVRPSDEARQQGERPFADTLEFTHQKVAMSACAPKGFGASVYSTAPIGGKRWMFKTDQYSRLAGRTFWNGDILSGTIRGTMIWSKPSGQIVTYQFDGRRLSRPAHELQE